MKKYLLPALLLGALPAMAADSFPRTMVIEEGTYTTCSWCPRGTVAMKHMEEKYPDTFIGIAVHSAEHHDPMGIEEYEKYLGFKNFPSSNTNRTGISPHVSAQSWEEQYLNMPKTAAAGIEVKGEFSADQKQITVTAKAEFAHSAEGAYNVAIVLLENGVTGYAQSNAFAGGANGEMGGYESKDPIIEDEVFNHVARGIYPEFAGASLCNSPVAGEPYTYDYVITIPAKVKNNDKLYLAALLLNAETGEIVNAARYYLTGGQQGNPNAGDDPTPPDTGGDDTDPVITVEPTGNYDAINLGLSVKWAAGNMLGADADFKEGKPSEIGGYFGWGDASGELTSAVVEDYVTSSTPMDISGTARDIARVKWGGDWRLPTVKEMEELIENTTCKSSTLDGVPGLLMTSKINGNSMFLPLNGTRYEAEIFDAGSLGAMWTSERCADESFGVTCHYMDFDKNGAYSTYVESPVVGCAIRPVCNAPTESVNTLETGKSITAITYYSLDGKKLSTPAAGISIEKLTYTDGTITTRKVVRR